MELFDDDANLSPEQIDEELFFYAGRIRMRARERNQPIPWSVNMVLTTDRNIRLETWKKRGFPNEKINEWEEKMAKEVLSRVIDSTAEPYADTA